MNTREAVAVIEWAQARNKLQDWSLTLQFHDAVPEWVGTLEVGQSGAAEATVEAKTAKIWVSPTLAGDSTVDALIHEVLEVLWEDVGFPDTNKHAQSHGVLYRMAAEQARAYELERKGKRHGS